MKIFFAFFLILGLEVSAQTVYQTPSGTKYHLANCRMVKNVSSALNVETALKKGFAPCKICKPPSGRALGLVSKTKRVAGTNSANRCYAMTKSGTRCKRNTRIGNNFCFQHLPK